ARGLRRPDLARHLARRSAVPSTDDSLFGDQPQDCKSSRSRSVTDAARPSRRGDRMSCHGGCAPGWMKRAKLWVGAYPKQFMACCKFQQISARRIWRSPSRLAKYGVRRGPKNQMAFPMRPLSLSFSGRAHGRFRAAVSAAKNPVPGAEKVWWREFRLEAVAAGCARCLKSVNVRSVGLGQTKPLKLQRPFGRRITQGGDADAARKPPFDGGLHQSRRDECHRYRHVDVTNTALLARGNGFDAGSA